MKKFIKYILGILLATLLIMVVLDFVYTKIYSNSYVRNKIQFVLNAPPKHYDVIILGSSRAENHIIPVMFKKKGLDVYNLGMSGGNLCENSLMLQLFFERGNSADKILLQLDVNFQNEEPADGVKAFYLPYFPIDKTVYDHYVENTDNSFFFKYVPFYRYCQFDSKIGFREMIMTLTGKENRSNKTNGFEPLEGKLNDSKKYDLPKELNHKNKYYDQIVAICSTKNVPLISFMSPFCFNVTNRDFFIKLKQNVPEVYDYSGAVKEDSLFASCGHMNKNGARIFTNIILKEHFSSIKELELKK